MKFGFSAAAHVVPRDAPGFVRQSTAGSPLNFGGPGSFHVGWLFGCSIVKAGQEFGGDVSPLVEGQRQGFTQQILRS